MRQLGAFVPEMTIYPTYPLCLQHNIEGRYLAKKKFIILTEKRIMQKFISPDNKLRFIRTTVEICECRPLARKLEKMSKQQTVLL